MNSRTAHYGHRLSLHLNVSGDDEHHDEALELYDRLKEPDQFKRIHKFKADLGMATDRLDIFIEEQDPGVHGHCLTRSDHFMKGIYLMTGEWRDDDHPIHTLAHEMIHAAFAAHMTGWMGATHAEDLKGTAEVIAAVSYSVGMRGEEKMVDILTELLWERLLA